MNVLVWFILWDTEAHLEVQSPHGTLSGYLATDLLLPLSGLCPTGCPAACAARYPATLALWLTLRLLSAVRRRWCHGSAALYQRVHDQYYLRGLRLQNKA